MFRGRTQLKTHNQQHREAQIFINEDLTMRRASLAFQTRMLKKARKINDCWTANGKIVLKDLANKVVYISAADDLKQY